VIAGALLAMVAYAIFLRTYPRERIPEMDRRLAPAFALVTIGSVCVVVAGMWIVYLALD
jgi:hypothetical protein